ncbi:uncharacterized protein F5147DRAFT_50306 [Suillus discolor]|uniref:Ricin B lectin domain-containing protein n=1 Tax=Suillus discolor TaxID=1912936 RepID=A0A9P7FE21_9AGAM|nr:uncharacterized protein F5147DRAFT_50306 [Suillus discolor]KAG2113555.1 hypothetical protein F5147DRAFT_50306 [Suillus discolor]
MTISGNLKTGTYTLRNASTNDFVVVQGPKTAALVTSNDGRAENAAWVLEKLSGHYDKYNIRNFAHNSYATVNSVQKRSAALTCGREVCPWSIRPTGYGTYVSVFHQLSILRLILQTHMYIQDFTTLRCFAVLEPENVRGSLAGKYQCSRELQGLLT